MLLRFRPTVAAAAFAAFVVGSLGKAGGSGQTSISLPPDEPHNNEYLLMRMDVDREGGGSPELKIRGQADAEKKKSKWDQQDKDEVRCFATRGSHVTQGWDGFQPMEDPSELERRESELKERALRNKVVRTRKASAGAGPSSS